MLWSAGGGQTRGAADPLPPPDLARLASLHRGTMPGSVLSALGEPLLRRYYAMVEASPSEGLVVLHDAGRVVAAAVLSLDAETLLPRLLRHSPVGLAGACARSLVASAGFRAQLASLATARLRGDTPRFDLPEVTQIFTDPSHRKRGLGRHLLERVERRLLDATPHREYMVRTLEHHNQPTLDFYKSLAFEPFSRVRFCGDDYLCLKRRLD